MAELAQFPQAQYNVIYADPPWAYEMFSDKGHGKSPDQHYDCMSYEQLVAMRDDVLFATAPNAVCIMWAVWPKLQDAMHLMREWGFTYKTGGAWHKRSTRFKKGMKNPKTAFGTGYIYRSASEPWLLGTIGDPKINSRSVRNLIEAATRGHSRKPIDMYEDIERLFSGPYLELFARNRRKGWDCFGNQVDKFEVAA